MQLYNLLTSEEIQALTQPVPDARASVPPAPPGLLHRGVGLRSIRELRSWTLAELSARSSIPTDELRAWEEGEAAPTLTQLLQLAGGCGVSVDELLQSGGGRDPQRIAREPAVPPAKLPEGLSPMAQRLTYLRSMRRLTRAEAAANIGFTYSELASYENGYRLPELPAFLSLVHYYNVSPHLLLTGSTYRSHHGYESGRAGDGPGGRQPDLWDLREGDWLYKGLPLGEGIKRRMLDLLDGYETGLLQSTASNGELIDAGGRNRRQERRHLQQ